MVQYPNNAEQQRELGRGSYNSGPRGSLADELIEEPPAYPPGPTARRGLAVAALVIAGIVFLANRVQTGVDEMVTKLGRLEVTARLLERPEQFPQLGAYRYTYVLKYEVVSVHRQDPENKFVLRPGDLVYIGHYKPWLPRSQIRDSDWGSDPLGGKLDQFVTGEGHRMALDYDLQDLAPSGALDYCYPPETNRFFALWTNPTTL